MYMKYSNSSLYRGHVVASELKDWYECQIGSFSSEATICRAGVCFNLSWIKNDYHNKCPSPFLLEHQDRWSGCQPRVHERPRAHSRRGNGSNLNILIQPTAADTRRSIDLVLKLGQRRRRWTNVKPTLIQRLVSAGRPIPYQTQDITPKSN